MAQIYSKKAWITERILSSDMNRMENALSGRCATYVVDPTGANGDYQTIQEAINAVGVSNRGRIFLKRGVYNINATLTVPQNVEFFEMTGENGAEIKDAGIVGGPLVKVGIESVIGNGKYCKFDNLIFNGNGFNNQLLEVYRMFGGVYVGRCGFINSGTPPKAGIYIRSCTDVNIQGNYFEGHDYYAAEFNNVHRGLCYGNNVKDCLHGFRMEDCQKFAVVGNKFTDPSGTPIRYVMVAKNCGWIELLANTSIDFEIFCALETDFHDVNIIGNTQYGGSDFVKDFSLGATAKNLVIKGNISDVISDRAIQITSGSSVQNVIIGENVFNEVQNDGVLLENIDGLVLDNNVIRNPGQSANNTYDGIKFIGCTYVTVNGNVITSLTANKMRKAIEEVIPGDYANVTGNTCRGSQTAPGITIVGGNSIKANNIDA